MHLNNCKIRYFDGKRNLFAYLMTSFSSDYPLFQKMRTIPLSFSKFYKNSFQKFHCSNLIT